MLGSGSAQVGRRYYILAPPQTFLQVKIKLGSYHHLFLLLYTKISVTCSDILWADNEFPTSLYERTNIGGVSLHLHIVPVNEEAIVKLRHRISRQRY